MSQVIKKVYILRGISGSGKSTVAKNLIEKELQSDKIKQTEIKPKNKYDNSITYCSADEFFVDDKGKYFYDNTKLANAHYACLRKFVDAIFNDKIRLIIVDNTHIETWEFSPYSSLALSYGHELTIVEVLRNIEECIKVNVHQVPEDIIISQYNRFEATPRGFNAIKIEVKTESKEELNNNKK